VVVPVLLAGQKGLTADGLPAGGEGPRAAATAPQPRPEAMRANQPVELKSSAGLPAVDTRDAGRLVQTVVLFGLISLAPVAVLMVTAFVRINIVLLLLRQALGSPQVPGNQVLTALALLLTALVMWPMGEVVYHEAIEPYAAGQLSADTAWTAGTRPIKAFMLDQIHSTGHRDYLQALYEYATPSSSGRAEPLPVSNADLPLRVVAPAYLLSELTTALMMGFYLYLPFLIIDLVVASVLASTGLFMLPPALVATPVKLVLFVLADGWLLVATMLLKTFGAVSSGP
jgi:flagellar biosynthetic protein FliP